MHTRVYCTQFYVYLRADNLTISRTSRQSGTPELDTYALGVCLHLLCAGGRGPGKDGSRKALPRAWDKQIWTRLLDAYLVVDGPAPNRQARVALIADARRALDARCPGGFADLLGPLLRHARADYG